MVIYTWLGVVREENTVFSCELLEENGEEGAFFASLSAPNSFIYLYSLTLGGGCCVKTNDNASKKGSTHQPLQQQKPVHVSPSVVLFIFKHKHSTGESVYFSRYRIRIPTLEFALSRWTRVFVFVALLCG
jgi:hypothetical protein